MPFLIMNNKKQQINHSVIYSTAISIIVIVSLITVSSQFQHQALAQEMPFVSLNQTDEVIDSQKTHATASEPEIGKSFIQQGTVSSEFETLPGHELHQVAYLLSPRSDGGIYTGVLTYTASKPVEVEVIHPSAINNTIHMPESFGEFAIYQLGKNSITESIITANNSSTSIPFTGNGLALHTTNGEYFVASYTLTAQAIEGKKVNNIETLNAAQCFATWICPEEEFG
jgi:hypothetical protein